MINENRIKNKMRKIEQLSKLYNEVDKIEKKEIIDDNKFFKVENKNIKYMSFYREKIKDKKKYHFNLGYNKYKFKKIKDKYIYEDKSDYNYKTFYKKLIPKLALNSSDKTVNENNFSDLSDISNSQINSRNKNSNFLSLSFPNIQSKNNKKEIINYSPIEKKNLNYSLKIYLKNKELRPIIHKTINEGKKINKIIRHNYVLHKEPKIKNNLLNILEDDKMDLEKLRNELNLKDSHGIYGKINEIQIMKNNLEKMKKIITKKEINIIKSINRGMIKEDLLLNKRLIYNVGLENRVNRQKYLELYNVLTKTKHRKRIIESNYTFDM